MWPSLGMFWRSTTFLYNHSDSTLGLCFDTDREVRTVCVFWFYYTQLFSLQPPLRGCQQNPCEEGASLSPQERFKGGKKSRVIKANSIFRKRGEGVFFSWSTSVFHLPQKSKSAKLIFFFFFCIQPLIIFRSVTGQLRTSSWRTKGVFRMETTVYFRSLAALCQMLDIKFSICA